MLLPPDLFGIEANLGGGVSVSSGSVLCVCDSVRGVRVKNGVSLKLIKE